MIHIGGYVEPHTLDTVSHACGAVGDGPNGLKLKSTTLITKTQVFFFTRLDLVSITSFCSPGTVTQHPQPT